MFPVAEGPLAQQKAATQLLTVSTNGLPEESPTGPAPCPQRLFLPRVPPSPGRPRRHDGRASPAPGLVPPRPAPSPRLTSMQMRQAGGGANHHTTPPRPPFSYKNGSAHPARRRPASLGSASLPLPAPLGGAAGAHALFMRGACPPAPGSLPRSGGAGRSAL